MEKLENSKPKQRFPTSRRNWKVVRDYKDEYFYEIYLYGTMVDRIKIEEPSFTILKRFEIIK